jgi:glycosyltransferase involved in cell wall biosynthesis
MMDGGSTDETGGILERYADQFAYVTSARDAGQSDAIRRGFERATGDIMAYLNSDDLYAPDAFFVVADFFDRHPDVDVVYSHRCGVDQNSIVRWFWHLPPHVDYLMKRWDLIPQETAFWRRGIYEKVGGIDASFRFAMDYDLFVKFMEQGKLYRNDRFHGAFRQHDNAKTSQLLATVGATEIQRVWNDHGLKVRYLDPAIGHYFSKGVELRSNVFRLREDWKPGILPGTGYDYDRLWGNQLKRSEAPA